jgi:glycosyltransferase involved in cell wall biosynthesis
MRLGIYTDHQYHIRDGEPYGDRAFVVFIPRLAPRFSRLAVFGRLNPAASPRARYRLGPGIDFMPLPYYRTLGNPGEALRSLVAGVGGFWRGIADLDCIWLLGPSPFAVVFAMLAILRRKRIVLGVRQDYPTYIRARYPRRRRIQAMAAVIDLAFRGLARLHPVIVVGPEIASIYSRSPRLLEIAVSLVEANEIVNPETAEQRSYNGGLQILSVGRLDEEKNPLLLAQTLRDLSNRGGRWKLTVCGEGPMADDLEAELERLGIADRAELRGYVAQDDGLGRVYRDSHAFLHVSWTEGLPQVLLEAFAAGLPTVATDVGGIRQAVGDAVVLIPPGDPEAAVAALEEIAADTELRSRLIAAGYDYVVSRTLDGESMRVADFIIETTGAATAAETQ